MCNADDNALLTNTTEEMNHNLGLVQNLCNTTGMKLNINKCVAYTITPYGRRSLIYNDHKTPIQIEGKAFPLMNPEDSLKYLESKMNPWKNKICPNLVAALKEMITKVGKAYLKPRQNW